MRAEGVREERLRATAGLMRGLELTSWRGRSGRRYVVGVHPLTEGELLEVSDAVIVAVRRNADRSARLLEVAAVGPELRREARRAWIGRARARGANEMHVHRLGEGPCERAAIVADLADDAPAGEPAAPLTGCARDAPGPDR